MRSAPTPSRSTIWLRLFVPFALGYFVSYFLRNANAVIADDLIRELGLTAADLGLLTGAYLAAFGLAQLPLGLLLDRYGPRRVEASLLLIAAAGCLIFAIGESLDILLGGRALIGLGVSACLMASFATFARWFPAKRQASLNGAVMVAGALGALSASSPLAAVTGEMGWRSTFVVMAGIEVLMAVLIFTCTEKLADAGHAPSARQQWQGVRTIFTSRAFWAFAPQGVFVVGGFMALQSLWAVPFLTGAEGFSRALAAERMLVSAVGMLVGFAAVAVGASRLLARGLPLESVLGGSYLLGALALGLIAAGIDPGGILWFLLGVCYAVANLAYALLQKRFDLRLAGRVNTALNLMSFCGAFGVQWLFGVMLDLASAAGMATPLAYRLAMGSLVICQMAGGLWFWRILRVMEGKAHGG